MYIPKHFEQPDRRAIYELMRAYPLATLVVNTSAGLSANHVPLRMHRNQEDELLLQGHIALANPLWQTQSIGEALAVFQGLDSYVSPNWYPTKREHGKVVPTWNYTAVHAKGELKITHDVDWKLAFLDRLTIDHESTQERPWSVSDAPATFTEKLLAAIVGLELLVTSIHGKWKVSQNQPSQNRVGVRDGLVASGNPHAEVLSGFKT